MLTVSGSYTSLKFKQIKFHLTKSFLILSCFQTVAYQNELLSSGELETQTRAKRRKCNDYFSRAAVTDVAPCPPAAPHTELWEAICQSSLCKTYYKNQFKQLEQVSLGLFVLRTFQLLQTELHYLEDTTES